jgi:hypothetical protein
MACEITRKPSQVSTDVQAVLGLQAQHILSVTAAVSMMLFALAYIRKMTL